AGPRQRNYGCLSFPSLARGELYYWLLDNGRWRLDRSLSRAAPSLHGPVSTQHFIPQRARDDASGSAVNGFRVNVRGFHILPAEKCAIYRFFTRKCAIQKIR